MFAFDKEDCLPCLFRQQCTRARSGARQLTIYSQEPYEALQTARQRLQAEASKELDPQGAGIEGTISQAMRRMGLRRSRHIRPSHTHLHHVATAGAINLVPLVNWLVGEIPEPTRVSPLKTRGAA